MFLLPLAAAAQEEPTKPVPSATPAPTPPPSTTPPGKTGAAAGATVNVNAPPAANEDEEGAITIKASRNMDMQKFAESSQQELKIAGARTRYAINLFGDVQLGLASRSEGPLRKPSPAFAVGVFDMLFTANLEKNLSMTSEFSATYEPNSPQAELERLQLRWTPSKHFFIEAGRFHTDIGYWNVAYHHGKYLQLTTDRPRTILLHGGLLPVHWLGAQAGLSTNAGPGTLSLVVSGGTAREPAASASGHGLHGASFAEFNGVHAKAEAAGFIHRDLRFGVSGIYDSIPKEQAVNRPGLPDVPIQERILNAYIAFPSVPFYFITEGYMIQHSLSRGTATVSEQSKWRTIGAFALLGYNFGWVTPYIRGEYINSQVGAYIFDPFYYPASAEKAPFAVALDLKEGVLGARFDLSDWCSLKTEYTITGGVGTRRSDLPTPAIHSGVVNWSFGI